MSEHTSEASVDASTQPPLSELCSKVVVAINNVLFRYIVGLLPVDERYSFEFDLYKGNPFRYGDTHKCHETRTFPGLYYAVSGSYGLEYILTDEQREKLYANGVGAYDIDIKLIFDEETVPQFVKNAIANKSKPKRGYNTTKFYYGLMMDIIIALEPYLVPPEDKEDNLYDVEGMGLLFNADKSRIDVLVGPLSMCNSLRNFLAHTPDKNHLDWKNDFAIFDTLWLFILCVKIGYYDEPACDSNHIRLWKLKKTVFRACVVTGVEIPDLTGVDMEEVHTALQTLHPTVIILWEYFESSRFQHPSMVRFIWSLDITDGDGKVYKYSKGPNFDEPNYGGGTSDYCVDDALENAKSCTIDALTLREMFGHDPKGRIKRIKIDKEFGSLIEEERTYAGQNGAGLGDGGYELGLSALGLLVAVAAALASSATR